jgi:hypothetical protein
MQDCINAIEEGEAVELSRYEVNALREFLDLADTIKNLEPDIEAILEEHENSN